MPVRPVVTKRRSFVQTGPGPLPGKSVNGTVQLCAAWAEQSHGYAVGIDDVTALEQRLWLVGSSSWRCQWSDVVRWHVPEELVSPVGGGCAFRGAAYGTLCYLSAGSAEECPPVVLHVGHSGEGGDDRGGVEAAGLLSVL